MYYYIETLKGRKRYQMICMESNYITIELRLCSIICYSVILNKKINPSSEKEGSKYMNKTKKG